MKRLAPVVLLALAAVAGLARGEADPGLAARGIAAYDQAQSSSDRDARIAAFARAERLFGEAAHAGRASADLYANQGTAALQAERLGPAVLAFRRALALDPDHARARRNLAHARNLLPDWVPRPAAESALDTFFFWHRSLSAAERAGAGAVCFLLAALALAAAIRWPGRLARSLAVLPALAWLGLLASLAVDARAERGGDAVIIAEETIARASDSVNAPARFAEPLPGGTEVAVVEARERWARVRLANGREAWIARESLETVRRG